MVYRPITKRSKKAGVDVKGKIVIVRYGNSFRGVKAKVAQDHGAVGLHYLF
jgi:N-acetylated-alpha-linked acidic dipeptidase